MGVVTYGISSITVGAVANDGGPGTDLAVLGTTLKGTGKLNQADPTTTQFLVEEQDAPLFETSSAGDITLTWTIADPSLDTLAKLFGGSVTGTTPKTWGMPASLPVIEQTVKVTPKQGLGILIPRGLVTAKLNGELTKDNPFAVDVTVKVLVPTKAGVLPIQFTN